MQMGNILIKTERDAVTVSNFNLPDIDWKKEILDKPKDWNIRRFKTEKRYLYIFGERLALVYRKIQV